MMYRTLRLLAIASALLIAAQPSAAEPFQSKTLTQASALADESGRMLIVYVTSEYASEHMDRTTWTNPVLNEWIDENAIAIEVDLYTDRDASMVLLVDDAPATILLKGGVPIYKHTGHSTAEDLLRAAGANDAADEASIIDRNQHRWTIDESKPIALDDVSRRIRDLIREEDYETALGGYIWLWTKGPSHQDRHFGSRSSYIHSYELLELTMVYPPAMRQFRIYRNKIENKLQQRTASFGDLEDWILLNEAVDEQERTISWVIRIKDDDEFPQTFRRTGFQIQSLLTERNMWALLGEIHPNPVQSARENLTPFIQLKEHQDRQAEAPKGTPDPFAAFGIANPDMLGFHTDQSSEIYAACLAAGRDEDAKKIEQLFHQLDSDGSLHILLTRRALHAGAVNERHLKMIDQASKMGTDRPDLRELVERALRRPDDKKADGFDFPA